MASLMMLKLILLLLIARVAFSNKPGSSSSWTAGKWSHDGPSTLRPARLNLSSARLGLTTPGPFSGSSSNKTAVRPNGSVPNNTSANQGGAGCKCKAEEFACSTSSPASGASTQSGGGVGEGRAAKGQASSASKKDGALVNCTCIPLLSVCDGNTDCAGGEDEAQCDEGACTGVRCPGDRRSGSGSGSPGLPARCIQPEWVCDGDDDCGDNSDEMNCGGELNCSSTSFRCGNGNCIPQQWVCDGDPDCEGGLDERDCQAVSQRTCQPTQHRCDNGACLPAEWRCDGDPDCVDMSDEVGCEANPGKDHDCLSNEFQCASGHCVKQEYRCDGEIHCADLSDEIDCGSDVPPCQDGDFRCPDGQCIAQAWKCDGEPDCQQGADEEGCEGLVSNSCSPNQMACTSVASCISASWVCDGEPDCHNGEDEAKCPIWCGRDQFPCSNSTCIGLEHVCNGEQDCPNGEDESDCTVPRDCESGSRCQHTCVQMANGTAACSCRSGYKLNDDGYSCSDLDECAMETFCSQFCTNTMGGFSCTCASGYVLRPDATSCKALGPPVRLIFANRVDIRQITLFEEEYMSVIDGLQNAIALDFHYNKKLIVWSDVTLDAIKIANMNGTNVRDVIWWGLESPGGVAIDWIHDTLYWTDSGTRRIEVCSLAGTVRRPLLWENVEKPRAIAVHPGQAAIFWTDWGQKPRIERADMDGSNRAILVWENVVWPNGLTVDYAVDRIYWADAKHHVIESVRLDGTGRRRVIERGLPHPFAITLFEDTLFWTDWHTKSIHEANKMTGYDMRTVRSNLHFPMDIHSFHPTRQPAFNNRCGNNNGGCSHLCLPNKSGFTCVCPAGRILKPDGRTCSESPSELLIFAQKSEIRLFPLNVTGETDHVLPLNGVRSAVALDWDGSSESIFWTDVESDVINRAFWNGTKQQTIVSSDLESPAGLAVDWVTKKLYWTDAGTNRIEVSNLDGSMRSLLIWEGLDKPRDIVVDPVGGYMYWTDWGQTPKIERAGMDGSQRSTIVSNNLTWPNGLAIDHEGEKLYWADGGTKTIEYATLDGKQRTVLIGAELPHPFGLALYEDLIFWSDWDTTSIHSTDKLNAKRRSVLRSGLKGLMDVRVYHSNRYSVPSLCQSHNGGCSHLCLLAPLPAGQSCACPTGIRLMSDGRTCEKEPSTSLLFSQQSYIRRMSFDMPYKIDAVLNLPPQKNVVALDIDTATGFVYWSDTAQDKIVRGSADGSSYSEVIVHNLQTVEGLAIDIIGRKIYWTDAGRRSIEVAALDGSNQKVLIWTGLEKPRGIVLHKGLMFWTDWGKQPRIEQADMDGKRRKVLISSDIGWPNSIAVDGESNSVYWTDAQKKTIESCDLSGQNRRVVLGGLSHPYGLTLLDDYIYWTDWDAKSVQRVEKSSGLDRSTVRGGLGNLMEIKTWKAKAVNTEANPCGSNNGGCSHLCLRNSWGRGYSCACPTGILMTEDGSTCKSLPNSFLLYASRSTLSRISLDTPEMWDVALLLPGVHNAVGVDFHYAKKRFYYTDVYLDVIKSVDAYNVSSVTTLVSSNLTTPDGIAVDWLADNIYWTDTGRNVLEVARLDGSSRKIIVSEGLDEPRAVAVFPQRGFLYWTDWGNVSKIERSFLDGSSRQAIVTKELGWPNGLAIDYDSQRLYWADAKLDRIETADLSGRYRVQLVQGASHPFGLTQLDDFLYWTDWRSKSIEKVDKATGKQRSVLREGLDGLMEIRAVSKNKQMGRTPCTENNGGCSHLCLYRATSYFCACPDVQDSRHCVTKIVNLTTVDWVLENGEGESGKRDNHRESSANRVDKIQDTSEASDNEAAMHPSMVVLLVFGILSLAVLLMVLLYRWQKRRFQNCGPLQPQQVSVLTFANPNYSSSVPDVVVADKKTFSWQRWKYDRNQERVYDIQEDKQSHLEAASLIPHSMPPPEVEVDLEVETDIMETSSPGPTPSGTPPPTPPQRLDSICM